MHIYPEYPYTVTYFKPKIAEVPSLLLRILAMDSFMQDGENSDITKLRVSVCIKDMSSLAH